MFVRVANCSGVEHRDRFNGEDYVFPLHATTTVPYEAAVHIFGMGLKDRSRQITRLGWAPSSSDLASAIKRLDAFLFENVVEEDEEEQPQIVNRFEPLSGGPQVDPQMAPMKARTQRALSKAS